MGRIQARIDVSAVTVGVRNGGISRDPVSLRRFSHRKVPGGTAFFHHLLDFVMNGPAPEASLAGPAPAARPEGADGCGFSPSPSRIRYVSTRVRVDSWWPCVDSLPGRCRQMWLFSVTFSVSLCAELPQRPLMRALQGMIKQRTGCKRKNHTGDSSMEVASSIRKKTSRYQCSIG